LFAGKTGGLHAVGPEAKDFALHLVLGNAQPDDALENDKPSPIMQSCSGCHLDAPGIRSVLSFRRGFTRDPIPARLEENKRSEQEAAAVTRKRKDYSWGLLEGLIAATSRPHGY